MVHIHDFDVIDYDNYLYADYLDKMMSYSIRIKPFLRPMSSMTEEEKDTYDTLLACNAPWVVNDWLNANHFDYRGLIPKGLAIAVSKENNPYK